MSEHRLGEIMIARRGSRYSFGRLKGVKKELDKLTKEATEDGLLSPYLIKVRKKTNRFSDNLNPLRRFLLSKVGQPWDQVYSELSHQLKPNTLTGHYILSHLESYVELYVQMIDGVPCSKVQYSASDGSYWKLGGNRDQLYVHPETRILCLAKTTYKPNRKPKKRDDLIRIDYYHQYRKIDEIWYIITLEDFTPDLVVTDVVLKISMTSQIAYQVYRRQVYAAHKRQCGKRELKLIQAKLARI